MNIILFSWNALLLARIIKFNVINGIRGFNSGYMLSQKAGVDQLLERLQHEESDIAGCGATIGKGQSEAYGAGRGCPKVGMLIRA